MEKTEFISALDKAGITDKVWLPFEKIIEIRMKDGSAFYPSIQIARVRYRSDRRDGSICILYGNSEKYGDKLKGVGVSYDMTKIRIVLPPQEIANGMIPMTGDIIRMETPGVGSFDDMIASASIGANMSVFELRSKIPLMEDELKKTRFSFYSPLKEKPFHMRGDPIEGVYLNFVPNPIRGGLLKRDFHERIKCGDIEFISLT